MIHEPMSTELRLAAIVTLLSSSALRGPTRNKLNALRDQLAAALCDKQISGHLRDAIEQALAGWPASDCHRGSISIKCCPLVVPGHALH